MAMASGRSPGRPGNVVAANGSVNACGPGLFLCCVTMPHPSRLAPNPAKIAT